MRRPFRGVIRTGVIAGIVGTAAMDLVWYRRYRNGGGDASFATGSSDRRSTDSMKPPHPRRLASLSPARSTSICPTALLR